MKNRMNIGATVMNILYGTNDREKAIAELTHQVSFASILISLITSNGYKNGLLYLIEKRKNELVDRITSVGVENRESLTVRLDELKRLTNEINLIIKEGEEAKEKLKTLREKEKTNV